ncbi:MAG: NirD/YgiW/YdeI family stress tolerance protein [Alphaproteobacteria bacterium]|nr:NirD/YgiW/YdeI family stress tolerance protein [Alphaproteobacteria bacterium]
MKKLLALLALGVSVVAVGQAVAQNMGGGFEGPGITSTTVADALKLNDDAPVVLKGKIEKALGNEKYQFNDGTGTIVVEIDDDEWKGLTVKPEMLVQISGEIDKELMQAPEVDVDSITLAQ